MTTRFHELTGPQTATVLTPASVLLVPIGAIEHHGPHLPLVTDALMAEAAVEALVPRAREAGIDAWQLPTLQIAKSDEHCWAPGTLWLSGETLMDVLVEIGRSITTTPARKVVFVNGHGGNVALLQVANRELRRRFGLQTFSMPALGTAGRTSDDPTLPDEHGLGIHGGWAETSIVMHLRPDLVHPELFARNVPEWFDDYEMLGFNGKPVSFGWLSDDFGPAGIIGDPTAATAAAGKALFDEAIERGLVALGEIDRFTLPERTTLI
ncbi:MULTISPECIES: creatininase family protein [Microbacterium]|uniref:Creatinine amidohydrolase n=2 Tax=Microbacterium TaxID=33882 RepID=A0A0F0LRT1_9MICO|nr:MULTISPECIES: creatininase family protein [Microbacterium]MCK9916928.1 creatininase family protein [Microbacteriaceae bacterium K1510]KJL35414.1 Creatinine amidohydrolase [Microbacterium ginsengisoli]KQR91250.1 creatinine amidohydrolase [Microbacterium sp. Leaf347]ODU79177.1 MAG: creatinine amidohydrolase [Microbacterium sp. SCN 71-21]OJU77035.1 MAG: creatinine amidohydrolase [Microbacterium sp. 71-23]